MYVNVIFAVEAPQQRTFPPENRHQLPSIWGLVGRWRAPGERHQCSQEGSRDLDCLDSLDISGVDIGDAWWNSDQNWSYHFGDPLYHPISTYNDMIPKWRYYIFIFFSTLDVLMTCFFEQNASGEFTATWESKKAIGKFFGWRFLQQIQGKGREGEGQRQGWNIFNNNPVLF